MPFKTVEKKRKKLDTNMLENIRFYIKRPMLRIAYAQRMGISMWWGFFWTFIPLFMLDAGYSDSAIGIYIGLTQLPLFLLEFKTVNAVPHVGYRNILLGSYGFLLLICVLAFISPSIGVTLGLLLAGSFALSFLEPIAELFFFEQVTKLEEEKAYPTFSTSQSIGSILARLGAGAVLAVLATEYVYLFLALIILYILIKASLIPKGT